MAVISGSRGKTETGRKVKESGGNKNEKGSVPPGRCSPPPVNSTGGSVARRWMISIRPDGASTCCTTAAAWPRCCRPSMYRRPMPRSPNGARPRSRPLSRHHARPGTGATHPPRRRRHPLHGCGPPLLPAQSRNRAGNHPAHAHRKIPSAGTQGGRRRWWSRRAGGRAGCG